MSARSDADAVLAAELVQTHAPTWVVIWCPYQRRFDAWECSDPALCRTAQGRSAAELWDNMLHAHPDLWQIPPHPTAARPPAPRTAGHPDLPDVVPGRLTGCRAPADPAEPRGHTPYPPALETPREAT
ncbi:hypothetical protein [Streptosporangium sp. NPDC087985]|uniref:hypothetical protein n=1 Tax=Streptosporangium sp. NPDC087985 TaxID=3366196 RepID=UPI00382B51CD